MAGHFQMAINLREFETTSRETKMRQKRENRARPLISLHLSRVVSRRNHGYRIFSFLPPQTSSYWWICVIYMKLNLHSTDHRSNTLWPLLLYSLLLPPILYFSPPAGKSGFLKSTSSPATLSYSSPNRKMTSILNFGPSENERDDKIWRG